MSGRAGSIRELAVLSNHGVDIPVLDRVKFILSVLAWAVHLALSYPERPTRTGRRSSVGRAADL